MNQHAEVSANVNLRIKWAVTAAIDEVPREMRWWLRAHLVEPRAVVLCTSSDTGTREAFWLVTDHVGLDDAPCRIVFDGIAFGLEMTFDDGVSYLVHRFGSLTEAVQSI